jgi:hypothetical protein
MRHLWAIVLISAAALTTLLGASDAMMAQPSESQARAEEGPPPGGCTPIGVTASGEIVFPLTCRDFIEKHKAADRQSGPAETRLTTGDASKTPVAATLPAAAAPGVTPAAEEASKVSISAEASKPSAAVEASKEPAATDARKPPAAEPSQPAAAAGASAKTEGKEPGAPAAKAASETAAPATRQAAAGSGNAAAEPATTSALPKRNRNQNRVAGPAGCTRFRSYDAASATYRDFNGQRRPCS